jgi:spore coat protein U-like protein
MEILVYCSKNSPWNLAITIVPLRAFSDWMRKMDSTVETHRSARVIFYAV